MASARREQTQTCARVSPCSLPRPCPPVAHDDERLAVGQVLGGVLDRTLVVGLVGVEHRLHLHLLSGHHDLLRLAQVAVDQDVLVDLQGAPVSAVGDEWMRQGCTMRGKGVRMTLPKPIFEKMLLGWALHMASHSDGAAPPRMAPAAHLETQDVARHTPEVLGHQVNHGVGDVALVEVHVVCQARTQRSLSNMPYGDSTPPTRRTRGMLQVATRAGRPRGRGVLKQPAFLFFMEQGTSAAQHAPRRTH